MESNSSKLAIESFLVFLARELASLLISGLGLLPPGMGVGGGIEFNTQGTLSWFYDALFEVTSIIQLGLYLTLQYKETLLFDTIF